MTLRLSQGRASANNRYDMRHPSARRQLQIVPRPRNVRLCPTEPGVSQQAGDHWQLQTQPMHPVTPPRIRVSRSRSSVSLGRAGNPWLGGQVSWVPELLSLSLRWASLDHLLRPVFVQTSTRSLPTRDGSQPPQLSSRGSVIGQRIVEDFPIRPQQKRPESPGDHRLGCVLDWGAGTFRMPRSQSLTSRDN